MRRPWGVYLMESWSLAVFMLYGGLMKVLLFHPDCPLSHWIEEPFARNALVALLFFPVMRYGIVDAPWGRRVALRRTLPLALPDRLGGPSYPPPQNG